MSPKLVACYEYRFVRPEDVNPDTDTVVTDSPVGEGRHYYRRALTLAEDAKAVRERSVQIAAANGGPTSMSEECRRAADHMEAAAQTEERVVCVRRRVL